MAGFSQLQSLYARLATQGGTHEAQGGASVVKDKDEISGKGSE